MHFVDSTRLTKKVLATILSLAVIGTMETGVHARDVQDAPLKVLEAAATKSGKATGRAFAVDEVWGGTGVTYDAVADGAVVYVAYYDAQRQLAVTRIDTQTGERKKKVLNSRFAGWDAHNYVTVQLDSSGILHVAANMHASPLVYGRTDTRGNFESLALAPMVGREENSATYPKFFTFPNGEIGFSYRQGGSGDGLEYINRFTGKQWVRLLDTPLFAPSSAGKHVNAYPSAFTLGSDGFFHVAWIWRSSPAVETNHHVNYARSRDLIHWENSSGKGIKLPITPDNAETVDPSPEGSGLMNSAKIGFDTKGKPIISYTRFDTAGNTQLFHARPSGNGRWQVAPATEWSYRWNLQGRGTVVSMISFSGVHIADGKLNEDVNHKKLGSFELEVDESTLKGTVVNAAQRGPARLGRALSVTAPYRIFNRVVDTGPQGGVKAAIQWESLGVENNDKPRTCESSSLPKGCAMTSLLELFVR
jgi:BNR repeat-containing family member